MLRCTYLIQGTFKIDYKIVVVIVLVVTEVGYTSSPTLESTSGPEEILMEGPERYRGRSREPEWDSTPVCRYILMSPGYHYPDTPDTGLRIPSGYFPPVIRRSRGPLFYTQITTRSVRYTS